MDTGSLNDFNKLTAAQLTCLRLVNQHQSSKHIAIALGISHHTVDQRISRACKTLGVATRGEAARLVAKHDAAQIYEPFVYEPPYIAVSHQSVPFLSPPNDAEEDTPDMPPYQLNDVMTAFDHNHQADGLSWQFLHPSRWGETNDLTIPKRLAAALAVCVTCLMVAVITIASLEGLSRLFSQAP